MVRRLGKAHKKPLTAGVTWLNSPLHTSAVNFLNFVQRRTSYRVPLHDDPPPPPPHEAEAAMIVQYGNTRRTDAVRHFWDTCSPGN